MCLFTSGSFDSSVHISEEASNAATAVPWAIVGAISIAGVLGWGAFSSIVASNIDAKESCNHNVIAINVSLAFCMGTDLASINDSDQPMAQIFFNSFGQKGTLAIWVCFSFRIMFRGTCMLTVHLFRQSLSLYSKFRSNILFILRRAWACTEVRFLTRYMMGSSMVCSH